MLFYHFLSFLDTTSHLCCLRANTATITTIVMNQSLWLLLTHGTTKNIVNIVVALLLTPGYVQVVITAVRTATVLIAMRNGTVPTAVTVWITRMTNATSVVNALKTAVIVITAATTVVKKATLFA